MYYLEGPNTLFNSILFCSYLQGCVDGLTTFLQDHLVILGAVCVAIAGVEVSIPASANHSYLKGVTPISEFFKVNNMSNSYMYL